jgi:hypothetical protein
VGFKTINTDFLRVGIFLSGAIYFIAYLYKLLINKLKITISMNNKIQKITATTLI